MGNEGGGSSYSPSYAYQNPSGRDNYGNPTYTSYKPQYAYQNQTGRDAFGNPTYDWFIVMKVKPSYYFSK